MTEDADKKFAPAKVNWAQFVAMPKASASLSKLNHEIAGGGLAH